MLPEKDDDPFITTTTCPTRQPSTPPIFLRDFAYPHSARVVLTERMRMASERSVAKSLARDFAGLLSGPMVEIYVGKERKQWSLHRNLLCHHSPYFETELLGHEVPKKQNGEKSNKLELPDDDPRGFELFVKWLYQGQLDDVEQLDKNDKYEYAVACHKLYLLSSKFSMPHLSNLAMDAYRQNLNAAHLVPDADEINDIYRSSPPGSPFRRLMTKIAARQIMDPEIDKDAETYRAAFDSNPDFAVEMVNAIRYMSGGILFENPVDGKECEWHDHSDGSDCSGQKMGKGKGRADVPYMNGVSGSNGRRIQSPTMTRVRDTPLAELPTDKRTPRKLNLPPQQSAARPGAQQTSTTRGMGRKPSTPLQNATGVSPSPTKPVAKQPRPVMGKRATSHQTNGVKSPATPPRKTASAESSPIKLPKRPKEQAGEAPQKVPTNSHVAVNGTTDKTNVPANTPRKVPTAASNALRAVSGPPQMNGHASKSEKAATVHDYYDKNNSTHVNGIIRQPNGPRDSKSGSEAKSDKPNGASDSPTSGSAAERRQNGKSTAVDGFGVYRAGAPSEIGTTTTSSEEVGWERKQPVRMKRKVPG